MTQDERWKANWQEVMDFMEANKRRPSKFVDSERGMRNWWKQQQKLVNAGALKPDCATNLKSYWKWVSNIDKLISGNRVLKAEG